MQKLFVAFCFAKENLGRIYYKKLRQQIFRVLLKMMQHDISAYLLLHLIASQGGHKAKLRHVTWSTLFRFYSYRCDMEIRK